MNKYLILRIALSVLSLSLCNTVNAKGPVLKYATMEADTYAERDSYHIKMLRLAVSKSGSDISLKPEVLPELKEGRAIKHVQKGIIDVYWMATNEEREKLLYPIRIPVYKGLIGWRLALVHKNNKEVFQNLTSYDKIKRLIGVQGHDWPDTDILIFNHYRITRSVSWTGMFEQVSLGRVDYFLRSVIEIHDELADRENLNLAIEPGVAFRYPLAFYLFVSRSNPEIAKIIERGMNIAIEDGSFDKLFLRYYGGAIERSGLGKRKIIHLKNPILPVNTPLNRSELWFSP